MRKQAKHDLRNAYRLHLQAGLIISLGALIAIFNINMAPSNGPSWEEPEQETVKMEEVIQTKQIEKPPPPPRPPVPVEVPNDEIMEDEILDLDAELDLDAPLDLPPPPPPAEEEEEPEVFLVVERQPEIKGGIKQVYKYLEYPPLALRAGIEGRVYLEFVVDERGRVVDPRVTRGIGGGCDAAAIEAVKKVKFTPGMQRGRPVKVRYNMFIRFQLTN